MRVAMVSARALPQQGGTETHVHEVSRLLAAGGVDVTVLTTDTSGRLPREQAGPGYRIRRFAAYPRSRDYRLAPALAAHLLAARRRYDLVHVQGVHTLVAPVALAAARLAGVPTLLTFHTGGHSSGLRGRLRPAQWALLAPLLRSTRGLVAVCEYERRTFARALGIPEERIRVIRNGCGPLPVDTGPTDVTGSPLLVSVGRLERYKGHHRILAAMPEILRRAPQARLVIAGGGPYRTMLWDMAVGLGVQDRVTLREYLPAQRGALGRLLADADLMCLLSEYEAHPVAVLEALAGGTAVLAADTSGLSELGRQGLITTLPLDSRPAQVAQVVLDLCGRPPAVAPALPSWQDCAGRLESLYQECVG